MLAELAEAKHVTRFLRKRVTEADILYSYWFTPKVLSLLEISKGKIPVVTRAHRYDLYLEANKLNCQFYKQEMEPSLSRIFFISGFGRDYFLSRFHKEEGPKYQIARLGVTGPARLPGHNHARELRLVSCSNCIEVKRVERIVQALSMAQGFAVSWLHIGGGSGLKGLILLAQALLGPLPHVEYAFQGEVPAGKVCDIYDEHDFDLFVSASASEGIPVSMMECMSRGIPVLSTDVGAVSELVNQSNGILIAPDAKAEDLWDKLRAFYFMTCEEKQAMRQSAYETFRRDYRAEINYENFCRDLLKLTE